MANKVKNSTWTVTFDKGGPKQLVLLTPGQFMADEFQGLDPQQPVESVVYIDAEDAEPMPMPGVTRRLELTVYKSHASPQAARDYCLAADAAVPVGITGTITIEVTGGATYTLATCAFSRWPTKPRRTGLHETETTYSLDCATLALGSSAAGPDLVGLDATLLNVAGNVGTLDAGGAAAETGEGIGTWTNTGTGAELENATAGEQPALISRLGLWLPGVAGNVLDVTNTSETVMQATFTVRFDYHLPSYRPAAEITLGGRWEEDTNDRSWRLVLQTDGKLRLEWSTAGTAGTVVSATSSVALPLGAWEYLGIVARKSSAAGGSVEFMLAQSFDSVNPLLRMGDVITAGVGTAQPYNAVAHLILGGHTDGTLGNVQGVLLRHAWWHNNGDVALSTATGVITLNDATVFAPVASSPAGLPVIATMAILKAGTKPARMVRGSVVRFDGANDSLAMASTAKLNNVSGATLLWYGTLNKVTGTQDLIFCGTAGANPRALLRMNGASIELHARRLDGDATATVSYASGWAAYQEAVIIGVVDYVSGAATIYVNGSPKASGALTSAGNTQATDSSETRLMAGQAKANPAAGDVNQALIYDRAVPFAEISDIYNTVLALSR